MPRWNTHNKWAERIGIPRRVSDFVNKLSDSPKTCEVFRAFCERRYPLHPPTPVNIWHGGVKDTPYIREAELRFLRTMGTSYIQAFYLHHLLDYIEWWLRNGGASESTSDLEDVIEDTLGPRLARRIRTLEDQDIEDVKEFIMHH